MAKFGKPLRRCTLAEHAGRSAANRRRTITGAPLKFTMPEREEWRQGACDAYAEQGLDFPRCLASRRTALQGWAVFAWAYGVTRARGNSAAESRRVAHATRKGFWRGYADAMLGQGGDTTYRTHRAALWAGGSYALGVHCLREDALAMAIAGARDMDWDTPYLGVEVGA